MLRTLISMACAASLAACAAPQTSHPAPKPGDRLERSGDEIMVAGQLFHTGVPVVLWTDQGGYDAYRVERRFARRDASSWAEISGALSTPNRYGQRLTGDDAFDERVRGGGWALEDLRGVIDQFVLHYDVCGTSRTCFRVLHDMRGLSVHFMLDIDGTIYQTLDVKERAWHATKSNTRSVGIEIANIGAYSSADARPLREWYETDASGSTRITLPERFGDGGLRSPGKVIGPSRDDPIAG
ncbi:MAG: peptidoglycan recognition family protein, partial [Planctomycetota bacterium]